MQLFISEISRLSCDLTWIQYVPSKCVKYKYLKVSYLPNAPKKCTEVSKIKQDL